MSAKKMVVPDKKRERDPDFVNAEIALRDRKKPFDLDK